MSPPSQPRWTQRSRLLGRGLPLEELRHRSLCRVTRGRVHGLAGSCCEGNSTARSTCQRSNVRGPDPQMNGSSSSNQRGSRDLILWIWILFSARACVHRSILLCSSPRATMEKPSPAPAPAQRSRPGRRRAARYAPYRRLRERAARLTYAERATHAQISSLVQAGDGPPRLLRSSSSNGGG